MMIVYRNIFLTVMLLLSLFCASTSSRETRELNYAERLSSSIDVLKSNSTIPEKAIPEGLTLRTDSKADHEFYNSETLNQRDILKNDIKNVPPEALNFRRKIERTTGSK